MSAYAVVLKPAKVALILFALSVAIAFAAVAGLARYRTEKEQTILQTEQQLLSTRENIKKLSSDLDSINRLAQKYQQLTRLGLIGEPDRDGWVQRLESIYRDSRLPPTLRYTLAPPQLLNPQPVPADAPTAYQNNVLHHDLALELSVIHDGEFLDFIAMLDTDWRTPYRVDTCQITREAEVITGLQIRCTVELYSLQAK
ncbi:MAG: hypothetical protein Q7U78_13750 [Gallionella sp.]|nr:hypothetical protein [Gallionella sp.]